MAEIHYKIIDVSLLSSSFNLPPPNFNQDNPEFLFVMNINQRIDEKQQLLMPFVQVKIIEKSNKDAILAEFMYGISFLIKDFGKVFHKTSEGRFIIPENLTENTNNISISTIRGCICERLRGTYISPAILPIFTHRDLSAKKSVVSKSPKKTLPSKVIKKT